MSSEQARRENVTDERKIEVEKDKVPKMTTHFESLAEKTRGEQDVNLPRHGEKVHQYETVPAAVRVGGLEYSGTRAEPGVKGRAEEVKAERGREEKRAGEHTGVEEHGGGQRQSGPSLEEISELRGTAQQNTMEAIRAAEERYDKAKLNQAKESKDITTSQGIQKGSHDNKEKDYSKGQQQGKEEGGAFMETAAQKARDVIVPTAQSAAEYAKGAKDTTIDTTMVAAQYVGEKAVAAKDVTVESGKGAAGLAGKVAEKVTDQAVVAGWGVAHYTLEKVAEATKTVAGVTSGVAGYTGEKAVVAKDKLAGAGQKVAGFAGEKIAAAKDAVVATEEKAAEYAARKQEAAKRDLEQKKHDDKSEGKETFPGKEQQKSQRMPSEGVEEEYFDEGATGGQEERKHGGGADQEGEWKRQQHGGAEHEQEQEQEQMQMQQQAAGGGGGGVFQAIGETIVEIGQTTKDLLAGQSPLEDDETKQVKEGEAPPYKGAGQGI